MVHRRLGKYPVLGADHLNNAGKQVGKLFMSVRIFVVVDNMGSTYELLKRQLFLGAYPRPHAPRAALTSPVMVIRRLQEYTVLAADYRYTLFVIFVNSACVVIFVPMDRPKALYPINTPPGALRAASAL
jgi:hypothetical protein